MSVKKEKQIQRILISQPKPSSEKSPYFLLAEKYNVHIDFIPFIKVESVPYKEFRKEKIDILSHTAVIFTSRNAVDNYFRICQESNIEVPADMKYFCITEQTAHYLQKYIVIRKRKIFTGSRTATDLLEIIKKHKAEKYLYPCSDIRKDDIPTFLRANQYDFSEAVMYRTVSTDLTTVELNYDVIAFFSPSGVKSLVSNFPDFVQGDVSIAAFGPTTASAVSEVGFDLTVQAPMPNAPSMTGALELFIKERNN